MFDFGKNRFLGIDIGTSSIKIAEIQIKDKRPILSNYAWMALPGDGIGAASFDTTLPEFMRKIIGDGKFKSKEAYVSLPASGGLITLIEFPEMSKEDLEQAVKYEAHKYIPTSLDEVVLSWDVVGKKSKAKLTRFNEKQSELGGRVQVLLVAAPKNKVVKYQKLIKDAGINLKNLEIESFSIVRSLIGNDQGNFVIVDMGYRVCNIILVEKGIIKVNRNIDAGGRDITKSIAKSMDIEEERAEKLKVSGRDFLKKESNIKFPVIDLIIGEVGRVVRAYYKDEAEKKVDGLILSGGTAGLEGIQEYFYNSLKIKTTVGNPFGRIEYDTKLDPAISKIKPRMSVCLGLALKGAEEFLK